LYGCLYTLIAALLITRKTWIRTKYIQATEQKFNEYLEKSDSPLKWMGKGSMGRDYFNLTTGKLVATYGHGSVFNIYTLVEQDEDGDDFTRDREEEFNETSDVFFIGDSLNFEMIHLECFSRNLLTYWIDRTRDPVLRNVPGRLRGK
jgi:hypothetical protein